MGVGLQPLEFSECLADSPVFREKLLRHEKELERTSQQIKRLIKEVKDVVHAAKRLGAAQLALADSMEQFEFPCIGASMTEDERVISRSLKQFAMLMRDIESERERMLGRAHDQIIEPLERFRKDHIGAVKEGKKKFDKKTAKFCQSQERTLALSTKKPDAVFQEADAALEMAERDLCAASGEYVFQLQAVQERKKFELVETLLGFVFGWWTFHHTAHDVHVDNEQAMRDLQLRIQRTRTNFEETSKQTESLMKKMMEMRQMNKDVEVSEDGSGVTRAGYLFLMEKKAFGTTWTKQYATYEKSSRTLTLLPYNQINVKAFSSLCAESMVVSHACALDDSERRAAWEARGERAGEADAWTLQAVSPAARAAWLHALSATRQPQVSLAGAEGGEAGHVLDENGFTFVRTIISTLEARGLTEQGLYRVAGVSSKVSRLVRCASNPRSLPDLTDPCQWESKTLTSALKGYLRALGSPLCTRRLHQQLIHAAKLESRSERVAAVHQLVHQLPRDNRAMLHTVVQHLCNVVAQSDKNLMSVSNVAVCFGPTLLRAERETVASILEIKFYNVIVETLIENFRTIFLEPPPAVTEPVNGHARLVYLDSL
ncbi:rho GTPase-activating protein Graf [Plutella xylostella]|uniref:rho GTPase-activating protein Graf n=1 Tax=Plutella xylostella TaxID=51655 RepID=UPI00203266C0|nr:rho GTPase-activating protein Graf [Plutella xylostella]